MTQDAPRVLTADIQPLPETRMRWPDFSPTVEQHLRVALLTIAVFASVLLPYRMLQRNANLDRHAAELVAHSLDVKETLFELMYKLRDTENLVLIEFIRAGSADVSDRYAASHVRIDPLLAKLRELTVDNPEQQAALGSLQAIIEGRLMLQERARTAISAKNYDAASEALGQLRELFPFRRPAQEFLDREQALFEERQAVASSTRATAQWLNLAAFLGQLGLLGAVIFVSERQVQRRLRAEARAQQAVARSRSIVQTVREPIVVLDDKLSTLLTNTAFLEVYGETGELIGNPLDTLGSGAWSDPELRQRLLDVAARDRELWDYELTQTTADGSTRIVLVNARRMPVSDDGVAAILVTVNDVTAHKRAEEKIRELNRELSGRVDQVSEVNRELESFSYSVSHDLRAPLRHIAGFSDKLDRHFGDNTDERVRHYLGVIREAAQRMSALIEDLLLYSRLGRGALRLQPVDMNALTEEVRALLTPETAARSIEWRIGGLPIVMGDESLLRQVWQNLLGNAVKYTGQREHALIEVGVESHDDEELVFFVRDNGIGFDMEYAGKLFGVFQRLHKASEFPGTGIGLANVRRIVGRHGGRVWAEARPGEGATFRFSLPASIAAGTVNEISA